MYNVQDVSYVDCCNYVDIISNIYIYYGLMLHLGLRRYEGNRVHLCTYYSYCILFGGWYYGSIYSGTVIHGHYNF